MIIKSLIRIFFLEMAINTLFKGNPSFDPDQMPYQGELRVGQRFSRIVFKRKIMESIYNDCQLEDVNLTEPIRIGFTYLSSERKGTPANSVWPLGRDNRNGEIVFYLTGSIFLYE